MAAQIPAWGFVTRSQKFRDPAHEPMTGIEPACLAWEASALPLSYIGNVPRV